MDSYIDIYCERLAPGLWAEPLNAFTNLAFFVAAFFAFICAKKHDGLSTESIALIMLLCAIGAGSTAFHTMATKVTMMMDVLPILLYQIAFICVYALRVIGLSSLKTAGLFAFFIGSSVASDQIPAHIMNGSLSYAPAFLFLLGFAVWHFKNAAQGRGVLLVAAAVFALSLTFRSIDMALCEVIPFGTHFLWHCLNGVVLYLTTRAFIFSKKSKFS